MKGNLNDSTLEIMEIQKILEDIGGLLKEMHKKGFVHFDISPGMVIREYSVFRKNEEKFQSTGLHIEEQISGEEDQSHNGAQSKKQHF